MADWQPGLLVFVQSVLQHIQTTLPSLQDFTQHSGHASGQLDCSESSQRVSSCTDACSQGVKRPKVILGASGSVAAIKVVELAHLLAAFAEVKIVATRAARHFIQEDELPAAVQPIHGDTPVLCSHVHKCCVYCFVAPAAHGLKDKLCCLLVQPRVERLALLVVPSRCGQNSP